MTEMNYTPGSFELVVKYRSSENQTHRPTNTIRKSSMTGGTTGRGSRIQPENETYGETITSEPEHPSMPLVVSYACVDYRIEDGALFITERVGSHDGFIIPLSVIQEIGVQRVAEPKLEKTAGALRND